MHYAKAYKRRIKFLEDYVSKYYFAIRDAKQRAGIRLGISGISSLRGNEETPGTMNPKELRDIIERLPEYDCGVQG